MKLKELKNGIERAMLLADAYFSVFDGDWGSMDKGMALASLDILSTMFNGDVSCVNIWDSPETFKNEWEKLRNYIVTELKKQ
jgi:hypothetical protein